MCDMRTRIRGWRVPVLAAVVATVGVAWIPAASAQDCAPLLSLFQQGLGDADIAQATGLRTDSVAACRRALQSPNIVGPAGPAPFGAAGRPPVGAAGPPPLGAAGRPPLGAAGRPPVKQVP